MYLVDTSVWIGYLNEKENEAIARFVDVLDLGLPFGITGLVSCKEPEHTPISNGSKST